MSASFDARQIQLQRASGPQAGAGPETSWRSPMSAPQSNYPRQIQLGVKFLW
jgi:hypothetical protein